MDSAKKRKLDENGALDAEAGPNKLTVEDVQRILEPFSHEQLFEIVKTAMFRDPGVLAAVRTIADRDPKQRKLFVRGLGWETNTEKLRSVFSAYGDIEEAIVITEKATGKSKGYGFVTFKHVDGALLSLKEPSKTIDGRVTVTQLASAGISGPTAIVQSEDVSLRKIYVANVPYDMPADRLLSHFSSYGEIEEGPLGFDKATGRSKGFALFVYKTSEAARASLVDPIKAIDGKNLACKLANDGKKGKPGMPAVAGHGGVQGSAGGPGETHGDGHGMHQQSSIPGSLTSQYGGPGGISSYGGFPGGLQGPQLGQHHLNSSMGGPGAQGMSSVGGGPGLSSVASHAPSSMGGGYGTGMGGPYSGGLFGGPGSTGYGGLGGMGGVGGAGSGFGGTGGGGLGGAGNGAGTGLGGAGRGSSLYGLPPSSGGMPSGGFPESAHYNLSSAGYTNQHHQPTGASQAPRVTPGGAYQGIPPYY